MSSEFTKRFQNSLGSQIDRLLKEWPRAQGLEVGKIRFLAMNGLGDQIFG